MLSIDRASMYPGRVTKGPRVPTSSFADGVKALFYDFDMARMLKGLLSELMLGDIAVEIPTYVRNDNADAVYQVDSVNTGTHDKSPNGSPESNIGIIAE